MTQQPDCSQESPFPPPSLLVETHPTLDSISADDWRAMFSDHPDSREAILLTESTGMEGFTFRSIVVSDANGPVLYVPLFDVRFALVSMLDGAAKRWLAPVAQRAPFFFKPRLLGIGFVEAEWGAVGVRPGVSRAMLREAWAMAETQIRDLARSISARIILLLTFTAESAALLPTDMQSFARIDTFPIAQLSVGFADMDAYLKSLSKNARNDLKKKIKSAAELRVLRTTNIEPHLDAVIRLYLQSVEKAEMSLGVHRKQYFQRICQEVPGTHYLLYFRGEELLAFNLLLRNGEMLVDKYFGMEPAGREFSLYFVSWAENVRYCIEQQIPIYHAGPGAEAVKVRLGAEFRSSLTAFRATNSLLHAAVRRLTPLLAYRPEVDVPPATQGTGWDALP